MVSVLRQGGIDPSGLGASLVATDVMWSDPVAEPGLRTNDARGVGLVFGPDATQVRLSDEVCTLVSHLLSYAPQTVFCALVSHLRSYATPSVLIFTYLAAQRMSTKFVCQQQCMNTLVRVRLPVHSTAHQLQIACWQRFLEENGLRLVLRSHEGPDARYRRDDLPSMAAGFTIDHVTPAGRLMTVFSAPDYPQFQVRRPDACLLVQ